MIPEDFKGSRIVWQRNGSGSNYIGAEGNVGNLWRITRDRKKSRLTGFKDRWIDDLAISPSGKFTAIVRTKLQNDVVLTPNQTH